MNDEPSIFLGYHIFTWSAKPFFVRACEFGREWLWRVAGWRVLRGVAACATRSLPKKKGWVLLRLKNWTQNTHEYTGFVPKNRVAQKQRWVICFTYGVPSFSHRFPCPEPGVWCPLICWPHMWVTWSAAFDAADLFELLDLPQVGFVCIDVQQLYIYIHCTCVATLTYIYILIIIIVIIITIMIICVYIWYIYIYIHIFDKSICTDKDSTHIRALTSQSSWLRVGCASVFKRFAGLHVFAFHPTTWDMIIPSSLYHISLCDFISKQIYSLYIYYMVISFDIISHPKSIDHISLSSTTHTHTHTHIYIIYNNIYI